MSVSLYGSGQTIVQVVQTVNNAVFTTSSAGSYASITGWSATITPLSTSNKILVSFNGNVDCSTAGNWAVVGKIQRNGSDISGALGNARGSATSGTFSCFSTSQNYTFPMVGQYLDSPATTSATTYSMQLYAESGSGTLYVGGSSNTANAYNSSTPFVITLMEVAYA